MDETDPSKYTHTHIHAHRWTKPTHPNTHTYAYTQVDETDPSKVLQVINVRFAVKSVDASPSVKVMRVQNTGVLPLDFLLRYPRDDEDEPENWVDKDLQGIDEQTLNMILENKLFVCEPRRGHLEVGEQVCVCVCVCMYVYC